MTRRKRRGPPRSRVGNLVAALLVLLVLAGLPLAVLAYQSHRTGMTWFQVLQRIFARSSAVEPTMARALPEGERIDFLESVPIGDPGAVPRISNLQVEDLDRDGLLDVVVCDAEANSVSWIRQSPRGVFEEHVCASDIMAPAHVQAVDFDQDGDLDLVVAVLGMLFPNNDPIGSVVILENTGEMRFSPHVVVENVARVSDARAGDLDGDGDLDLAVAQFGYDDGESRWIENLGGNRFQSHILQTLSGPVNCEIVDINEDGSLDIILLVSQEWEEIYVFLNGGQGDFEPRLIYGATNEDFGSSGMSLCDLDQDGDLDILYTNGDAFDYIPPRPRPWHGVQWLENRGDLEFVFHRLADVPGAYGARPLDVDHDGDLDLFVVSAFNFWERPESVSFLWLENDGTQRFRLRDIASTPTHLLCLETGDFDGDGEVDFVSGGMHVYSPYDRMSRVRLWKNRWPAATEKP